MTGKAVLAQGALAAVGLLAAQLTWQREPDRAPGDVVVLDVGKNDLQAVRYEDEGMTVDLSKDKGDGVWLTILEKDKPDKPDKAHPNAATPPKAKTPREVRGGSEAEKLWNDFAPLRSPRALGVLDPAKAKELGVDGNDARAATLTITARGEPHIYRLGQPDPRAGGETYLHDMGNNRIYLLAHNVVPELQNAGHRLVDKRLHAFKLSEFDHLKVSAGGKQRELVQINPLEGQASRLAPASNPDKPDEMLRNWHEKVWRMFPNEILGRGETPADGEPTVKIRVDYTDRGRPVGWTEIGQIETPAMLAGNGSAPPGTLYARTEHTAGWVRLSPEPSLISDADKIAGGS